MLFHHIFLLFTCHTAYHLIRLAFHKATLSWQSSSGSRKQGSWGVLWPPSLFSPRTFLLTIKACPHLDQSSHCHWNHSIDARHSTTLDFHFHRCRLHALGASEDSLVALRSVSDLWLPRSHTKDLSLSYWASQSFHRRNCNCSGKPASAFEVVVLRFVAFCRHVESEALLHRLPSYYMIDGLICLAFCSWLRADRDLDS